MEGASCWKSKQTELCLDDDDDVDDDVDNNDDDDDRSITHRFQLWLVNKDAVMDVVVILNDTCI